MITACRVRLRPILMTSLATIIGLAPMALKLGTGGEQYTPMARAIIGGLTSSVLFTIFIVPAAYLLVYGKKKRNATPVASTRSSSRPRGTVRATGAGTATPTAAGTTGPMLTLQQAEMMALQNHPQIQAAQNEAAFAISRSWKTRSAYFPTVNADVTGSGANYAARIGAGFITDSRLFDRFGAGLSFTQLITDLGRTKNLVASSRLQAQAGAQNVQATRYDVLLQVNRAYFDVLHAQALIRTAQETIKTRQTVLDQVTQLAQNQLRSQLDVSFAAVNVSEAKLLLIQAQNSLDEAYAELARALGADRVVDYQVQEEPLPPSPPASSRRPGRAGNRQPPRVRQPAVFPRCGVQVRRRRKGSEATHRERSWRGRLYPLYRAADFAADSRGICSRSSECLDPDFQWPLCLRRATKPRSTAPWRRTRSCAMNNCVSRAMFAWPGRTLPPHYQRIDVTAQLVQQANLAVNLAQGRYNLGLASIVELSQAQLNQTQAEIENLSAKYDYQSQYQALQYTIGQLR